MIDCMRSLVKFILACFLLCLMLFVGAGLWVWYQLHQLPVSDLSLRSAAVTLHSARLRHLSFRYTGDIQVPVSLESLTLKWTWNGLLPQIQDVHADKVKVALSQYPTAAATDNGEITWPQDWQLPAALPARISVSEFALTLPCADSTCTYTGEFYLHHQEALDVAAVVSPARTSDRQHSLALQAYYNVTQHGPELALQLQDGDSLSLDLNAVLTNSQRLRGSVAGSMQQVPEWLLAEATRWRLKIPEALMASLQRVPKPLEVNAEWQLDTASQPRRGWLEAANGSIDLDLNAGEQVSVSLHAVLEQQLTTRLSGYLQAEARPALFKLFQTQLPASVHPYIDQLQQPLRLHSEWWMQLDEQAGQPLRERLHGEAELAMELDQSVSVADVGDIKAAAEALVQFGDGQLTGYQLEGSGTIDHLSFDEALAAWQLYPETLHWTVRSESASIPSLSQPLALDLQLHSTGITKLNLTSMLSLNLNDLSVQSPLTTLSLQQADWQWQNVQLRNATAVLPFRFAMQDSNFSISSSAPMQLSAGINFAAYQTEQAQLSMSKWHISGTADDLPATSLSAEAALTLPGLSGPLLHTQNVNWSGTITGASQQLRSDGRLRNNQGLVINHEAVLGAEKLHVQWDIAPIFWLAGNPLRTSLDAWPELLTLERGRSSAHGDLTLNLSNAAMQIAATLDMADVAGLYDTTSFSGLSSQVEVESDGEHFRTTLPSLTIQRLVKGVSIGPVQAKGSYQAMFSAPFAGTLQVDHNRASIFNGGVSIENTRYDLAAESVLFQVNIAELDLSQVLREYPASDLSGSGILSGSIPVRWSASGLSIEAGRLAAQPPGGELRYQSPRAQQLGERNQAMKLVVDALEDFHYSLLESTISYYDDGTLELALAIEGHNPGWQHNRPVHLTVRLQEDLPALIASLQLTNQVNSIIQERVQKRLLESLRR